MVWTVTDGSGNPVGNAQVAGNYSSGPSPGWLSGCSTGPGSPVSGYTNSSGQYVVGIPYTCAGGNYSVTVKANGYYDQSVTTPLGSITGDVDQAVRMTPTTSGGGFVSPPPGQGFGADWLTSLDTGSQAWGEWVILAGIAVAVVVIVIVVLARFG